MNRIARKIAAVEARTIAVLLKRFPPLTKAASVFGILRISKTIYTLNLTTQLNGGIKTRKVN